MFLPSQIFSVVSKNSYQKPAAIFAFDKLERVKDKILSESKPTLFSTGSDSDYTEFGTSLLGAPNKFLYSKYGRQPYNISGGVTISKS